MTKRQSLAYQMNQIIKEQARAIGTSRYDDKQKEGHAIYDKIHSIESYKTHRSRLTRFGDYLRDEGVRDVAEVQKHHVEEYMHYMRAKGFERFEKGYTHSYLANTLSTINHLLVDQPGHEPYRCRDFDIEGHRERVNNRDETERVRIPDRYQEQVELIKASGLRRHELDQVNTKSFYEHDGRIYMPTIGKGGRPRVAEVRADYYAEVKTQYSDFIRKVHDRSEIPSTKEQIQRSFRGAKEIYAEKIPDKYSLHRFRSEYANEYYRQIIATEDYEKTGEEATINGVTADVGAFEKLTESLGHSRIYVLASYLGEK